MNETSNFIRVALYSIKINPCFIKQVKQDPLAITPGCSYDGQAIEIIKLLLEGLRPYYTMSDGYGNFRNGTWSGALGDLDEGRADMTLASINPTIIRTASFNFLLPIPIHEPMYFVINPIPNVPSISIFHAMDYWSSILLTSLLLLTALFILLSTQKTTLFHPSTVVSLGNTLYNIWLQQRNRWIWCNADRKIIVTVWSACLGRVLYVCIKANFYGQFQYVIPIPNTLQDLALISPKYTLLFSQTANTYNTIFSDNSPVMQNIMHDFERSHRIKFVNMSHIKYQVGINPGTISFGTQSSAQQYLIYNKRLILKEIYPVLWSLQTSFFGSNVSKTVRNRISHNSYSMLEFGLNIRVARIYNRGSSIKHHVEYQSVLVSAWIHSIHQIGVSYLLCLLTLILEFVIWKRSCKQE